MLWHDRRNGCNDPGAHQIQRDRLASDASLPILIFVAATVVVTISTMHIIFTGRGFFEVSIWLSAISQVMPTRERPIASRQEPCLPYLSNLRSGGASLRYFESIAGRPTFCVDGLTKPGGNPSLEPFRQAPAAVAASRAA